MVEYAKSFNCFPLFEVLMKIRSVISLLLSIVLFISLCSCAEKAPEKGDASLCSWFDGIGFVEGLTQQEYISLIDSFSCDGKGLTKIAPYAFFENAYGNGCSGSCSSFSYGREEVSYEQLTVVSYLTMFTLPDGFSLPHGISIKDGAATVLSAFGQKDAASFFSEKRPEKTLVKKEGESLLLRNLSVSGEEVGYLYPYQLIYTERYESDGLTVERSLELYFSEGQDPTLVAARIHLSEKE
jgi:hypothetical protein